MVVCILQIKNETIRLYLLLSGSSHLSSWKSSYYLITGVVDVHAQLQAFEKTTTPKINA